MAGGITLKLDPSKVRAGLKQPGARAIAIAATAVQSRAKELVGYSDKTTGKHLRDRIVKHLDSSRDVARARIVADTPYAAFHHEGTVPHVITPKRAKVLRFTSNGETVFAKRVQHPGTRANAFLTDALRQVLGVRAKIRKL